MSKAGTPIKVLRTGLKRVDKGWTQNHWSYKGDDGVQYVCLEGALFGYCDSQKHGLTEAQKEARNVVLQIIGERYNNRYADIPSFNDDRGRTKEEIQEVIKLAIIRLETTGDGEMDEDDFADLLSYKDTY